MTKRLECPFDGCHAAIEADTVEEVMAQAEEHAKSAHPELELDAATVEDLKSKIRDV